MKIKYLNRVYEAVALLLTIGCLGILIFESTPRYDAQLGELNTAVHQSWQRGQQKVNEDMANLKAEVRKNGNSREGQDRIMRSELLSKKTREIYKKIEQWRQYKQNFTPLQVALKRYQKWLITEFRDLDIASININQTLVKSLDVGSTAIANQLLINEQKLRIYRSQAMVLRKLGAEDVTTTIRCCFGCRYIDAVPKATKIPVGEDYEADMYFGEHGFLRYPRFYINDQPIAIFDGKSKITFRAQNTGKKYWEAKFKFFSNNKDTTIVRKVYYEVK